MSKFAAFRKVKPDAKNHLGKDNVYDQLSPNPYNKIEKLMDTISQETGAIVDVKLLRGGKVSITANSMIDFYIAKSVLVHKFNYNGVNIYKAEPGSGALK